MAVLRKYQSYFDIKFRTHFWLNINTVILIKPSRLHKTCTFFINYFPKEMYANMSSSSPMQGTCSVIELSSATFWLIHTLFCLKISCTLFSCQPLWDKCKACMHIWVYLCMVCQNKSVRCWKHVFPTIWNSGIIDLHHPPIHPFLQYSFQTLSNKCTN